MKRINKILAIILVLALTIPCFVFAEDGVENLTDEEKAQYNEMLKVIDNIFKKGKFGGNPTDKEDDLVRVVVELRKAPIITFATKKGIEYSEFNEGEKSSIERNILNQQNEVKTVIQGKKIDVQYIQNFTTVFNGFSGKVKYSDIEKLEQIPQVKKVYISNEYERPEMTSSNEMVGSQPTWDLGYKGEGMVVAVIDTGVDYEHNDMALSEDTTPKLIEEDIDIIKKAMGLNGKYYTSKVPYGYNYYDKNEEIKDIGPDASEHGMHVAGTVAANGTIKGVAPEAQILAMKVFSNDPIYATTFDDIYLEAIEEAIKLGANVLNMSLGSTAGFYESESPVNVAITNAVENGIVCAISAGNSGSMTYGWTENYGLPFKQNPDIGVVGSPGISYDSIQVASIENLNIMTNYLTCRTTVEEDIGLLPGGSVIVGSNGYHIDFLDKDVKAQKYIVDTRKYGGEVYLKLDTGTIVDLYGTKVEDLSILPEMVTYSDEFGNEIECYIKEKEGTDETKIVKIPMIAAGGIDPSEMLTDYVEYVDCGVGDIADFEGKDMNGKVALIIRGGLTFVEKITNAQNAGASGVVIYNHEDGGEELINMAYPPNGNIPAVFIGHNGGKTLLSSAEKKVKFHDDVMQAPNSKGGEMSEFTSWGTTPTLELKPEITAPGGSIYSTLQNNKYGIMSGTSMASPHVAGGSALVMQYIKNNEKYKDLSIEEQAKLAKVLLMNTADIVMDDDVPYSPRRQGAGLMNLYDAVSTPVRIINAKNGEAKVELKDFDSTTFTMNLTAINDSSEDTEYRVDVDVLTDFIYPGLDLNLLFARNIEANVDKPETIVVPGNGSKDFTITVDISKDEDIYRNMFVEGFVKLEEITDTHPDLSIPFVGFYGDWNEPQILDGMRDLEEESYYGIAGMVDTGMYFMIPGKAAISPGTDDGITNGTDTITPVLSFMRNAEEVKYSIFDENGNNLRTIKTERYVRKNYIDGSRGRPEYSFSFARTWDGKIKGNVADDGLYYYQIKAKIQNGEPQIKKIPVYVDTKPPVVEDIRYDDETGMLSWKAEDETSGVLGFSIFINNDNVVEFMEAEDGKDEYQCEISEYLEGKEDPIITILAVDYAMNSGFYSTALDRNVPYIYIEEPSLFEIFNKDEVKVSGAIMNLEDAPVVKIDGEEVEVVFDENVEVKNPDDPTEIIAKGPGYRFEKVFKLEDGLHEMSVEAISQGGYNMSIVRRFYVDTTPPELEVKVHERDLDSEKAELEITMKDNFPYLQLYVWDSEEDVADEMETNLDIKPIEKTIVVPVSLDIGTNEIPITLVDIAGNKTIETITIERDKSQEEMVKEIEELIAELPEVEEITEENCSEVEEQLKEIEEKIVGLLTIYEEFDAHDIEGYDKFIEVAMKVKEIKGEE